MAIPGNLQQHLQIGTENQASNSESLFSAFTKVENNFNTLFTDSSPYVNFTANNGVAVSAAGNTVSITGTGVENIIEGTGITTSGSNGNVTISVSGYANGTLVAGVTKVGVLSNTLDVANSPVISQGNISVDLPTIGTILPGEYTAPTVTIDRYGRVTNIANTTSTGTVTSIAVTAGSGLAVTGSPITTSGEVVITNTGVTRLTAGTGIAITASTGNVTISSSTESSGTVKRVGLTSTSLNVSSAKITTTGDLSVELKTNTTIAGNLTANAVYTDHLFYANGDVWSTGGGSSYGNSNVAAYLPTYTGNITANNITANFFTGVLKTAAQPNITSVGNLTSLRVTGTSNLNAVGNITITGGTSGQFLQTDGSGHLSWASASALSVPSLAQVTAQGNTSSSAIHITSTTTSTSPTTGALVVDGGLGVAKAAYFGNTLTTSNNVVVHGNTVYIGPHSDESSFTNPALIIKNAGAQYIQAAIVNSSDSASADWVAYGDRGSDISSWSDMGFTGSNFNDANYTITNAEDGYFFVQGYEGAAAGGNLVLATGGHGTGDIVFATGGFQDVNEVARIRANKRTLEANLITLTSAPSTASSTGVAGQIAYDSGHVYICVATNTWKRATLSTW